VRSSWQEVSRVQVLVLILDKCQGATWVCREPASTPVLVRFMHTALASGQQAFDREVADPPVHIRPHDGTVTGGRAAADLAGAKIPTQNTRSQQLNMLVEHWSQPVRPS
jgi:hypothetical protein